MNSLIRAADQMFKGFWPDVYYTYSDSQTGFDVPINAYETKTNVIIDVFIPGVKKEDLGISLEGGILTIHGKLNLEFPKDSRALTQEAYSGEFSRKLNVGKGLDPDNVIAKINAGVLTITIPKIEKPKPNKILVED